MPVVVACIGMAVVVAFIAGVVRPHTNRSSSEGGIEEPLTRWHNDEEAQIGPALRSYADKELQRQGFVSESYFSYPPSKETWLERLTGTGTVCLVMQLRLEVCCARQSVPNDEALILIQIPRGEYRRLMAQDASAPPAQKPADAVGSKNAAVGLAQKALIAKGIDVKGTPPDVSASEAFWVVAYVGEDPNTPVSTVLISKRTGTTQVYQKYLP